MAIDLLFEGAPLTTGALVFGDDGSAPPISDATISVVTSLADLTASIGIRKGNRIGLAASLPQLEGAIPVLASGKPSIHFIAGFPDLTGTLPLATFRIHCVQLQADLPALGGNLPFIRSGKVTLHLSAELPGLSGTLPVTTYTVVGVAFAGDLPALTGVIEIAVTGDTIDIGFSGELPALTAFIETRYDSRTERPETNTLVGRWQGAVRQSARVQEAYQQALAFRGKFAAAWKDAQGLDASTAVAWSDAVRSRTSYRAVFDDALPIRGGVQSRFEQAEAKRQSTVSRYERGIGVITSRLSAWQETIRDRRAATRSVYQEAVQISRRLLSRAHDGQNLSTLYGSRYEPAMRPPAGMWVLPPIAPPGEPCYTPSGALLFDELWASAMELVFICERHGAPAPIAGVVVPVLRIYMVINSVSLRRVDGDIALPVSSFTLSLDVDSWVWGFSASLPGHVLPDLEPASSGAPVELEAMVNGTAFRVLVESISRERTFGKNDIRVQGRGKTALLDSPYAPSRNFGNTAARTAQQLMGDVLSVNGVPMDWTLSWGLTDWLVPANVFAHQGSYISALNAIAQAAGGYIQPHASLQSLDVLARYPVAPWNWDTVAPDFELPSDVTTREGIEWVERARYNRVFVSGQQSGVLGQVTRDGTAGDLLAPMVTDALITHADVARQRGISVLGNTGRQANISLRLPVLPETGIIVPGKFVRYTDAGTSRLGIVRSMNLDAGFPNVFQTIGVETHV